MFYPGHCFPPRNKSSLKAIPCLVDPHRVDEMLSQYKVLLDYAQASKYADLDDLVSKRISHQFLFSPPRVTSAIIYPHLNIFQVVTLSKYINQKAKNSTSNICPIGAVETISNGDKYSNVQFVVIFCTFFILDMS